MSRMSQTKPSISSASLASGNFHSTKKQEQTSKQLLKTKNGLINNYPLVQRCYLISDILYASSPESRTCTYRVKIQYIYLEYKLDFHCVTLLRGTTRKTIMLTPCHMTWVALMCRSCVQNRLVVVLKPVRWQFLPR